MTTQSDSRESAPKDDRPNAPVDASDLELLRTFEPVVFFTQGEQFFPTDIERYVKQSSLWVHFPDRREEALIGVEELDVERLVAPREYPFGAVEFLRLVPPMGVADGARVLNEVAQERRESGTRFHPGLGRLARGGYLPRIADALFSVSLLLRGRVPAITAAAAELAYNRTMVDDSRRVYYGRVVRHGGWTVLQYWFFYYYNSWRSGFNGVNDHESDWENVVVYLYAEGDRLYPEWAAYASHDYHGADLRRRWDDRGQLDLVEGHPVVYAGAGSHASYFRSGEYQAAVTMPLPKWMLATAQALNLFWTRTLGQAGKSRQPFRIPFVDYARGDGKAIGPGQQEAWSPVVIDEMTPWVGQYRGLWGLYAHDPVSGENAPAGPMYNRDGSPRGSWFDPLGFAGLDQEPPPWAAVGYTEENCTQIEQRQVELDGLIEAKAAESNAIGVALDGMEGNPHLYKRYLALSARSAALRIELTGLRKERSENEALLSALEHKLVRLREGTKGDPQAHIRNMAQPVAPVDMRFNRAAEAWGAISLSITLFGIVALMILARSRMWISLIVMFIVLVVIESVLRREYARTITGISAILSVVAAVILIVKFWLWIIVALLLGAAFYLLVQKVREVRGWRR